MANMKTFCLVIFGVLFATSAFASKQWGIPSYLNYNTGSYGNSVAAASNQAGQTYYSNAVVNPVALGGYGYGVPYYGGYGYGAPVYGGYGYGAPIYGGYAAVPVTQGVYYSDQQSHSAASYQQTGATQTFSSINDGFGGSNINYADNSYNHGASATSSVGDTTYANFMNGPLGASQTYANTNHNNQAYNAYNNGAYNNFNQYVAPAFGYYPGYGIWF